MNKQMSTLKNVAERKFYLRVGFKTVIYTGDSTSVRPDWHTGAAQQNERKWFERELPVYSQPEHLLAKNGQH